MKAGIPKGLARNLDDVVVGEPIVTRAWKFDGSPHWITYGLCLGQDADGVWVYQPQGIFVSRPGVAFFAREDAVVLVPRVGEWVATFYPGGHRRGLKLYIDVSTGIGWRRLGDGGWEMNSIDMDLDVIDRTSTGVYLDDEDEFAEHQVSMGYPQELIAAMSREASELLERVGQKLAPFDGRVEERFAQGRAMVKTEGK